VRIFIYQYKIAKKKTKKATTFEQLQKIPRNKVNQESKDLYHKNYKTLMKEIEGVFKNACSCTGKQYH
jgi:hypothetical protein